MTLRVPPGHIPLKELLARVRRSPLRVIAREYPNGFLVLQCGQLTAPLGNDTIGGVTLDSVFTAAPVQKRDGAGNVFPHITLGRASNNDIVIPDGSVSKFQAFIKLVDGKLLVQDAGSTGGTRLGKVSVPARGQGDPVPLLAQCAVHVGGVNLTYVPTDDIGTFAESLSGVL